MVCSCGKIRNKPTFTYGVNKLEIVFEYMYLGVKVTYNGKFKDHMEYASLKGTKSMFALLQKAARLAEKSAKKDEKTLFWPPPTWLVWLQNQREAKQRRNN